MIQKKYYLKKDTVLDERYLIDEAIGEGGFGITYAGANTRIGLKVAIKEFYSRELMDRDVSVSNEFSLIDPAEEERFQKEKNRFLKEARILGDFSGEPGIVHVLDYFEANGTAYIVMEFISGITLKQYVKTHGKMDAAELFQKIKPLLSALEKIHASGLVHRDISPDNIMLLEDGSLCLIDFGAATYYEGGEKSFSVIYKTGYAAPEQYKGAAEATPASDFYALSASLYYCLTGIEPEDSLQRILVDEVVPAEQVCPALPKKASDIISKGMKLKAEQRWQNAEELLAEIKEVYPDPDVLKERKRKRTIIACVICAVVLLLLAGGLVYYLRHRVELKFRNIETEKIWLMPHDDMTVEEYREASDVVKQRLEVFAGKNNYLWKETADGICMEFPVSSLCGQDPAYACRGYLSRPMEAYLVDPDMLEEGEFGKIEATAKDAVPLPRTEFSSIHIEESGNVWGEKDDERYLTAELSPELAEAVDAAFSGKLKKKDSYFQFYFDLSADSIIKHYYLDCYSLGDGKTIALLDTDQEGNYIDTLYYSLTHETSPQAFSVVAPNVVDWEDPAESLFPGKFQKDASEIMENYLVFRFTFPDSSEGQQSSWVHNMSAFKERLDALEKPYAFGLLEYDQSSFMIKAEKDLFSAEELEILGGVSGTLHLGTTWESNEAGFDISAEDLIIEEGTVGLQLSIPLDSSRQKSLQEKIEKAKSDGVEEFYLFSEASSANYPIAGAAVDDLHAAVESGQLVFNDLLFDAQGNFTAFLKTCYLENLAGESANLKEIWNFVREDEQPESLTVFDLPTALTPLYEIDEAVVERMKEHAEAAGGEFTYNLAPEYGLSVIIQFFEMDPENYAEKVESYTEDFYQTFSEEFASEKIGEIKFYYSFSPEDEQNQEYLFIWLYKSSRGHRYILQGLPMFKEQADNLPEIIQERFLNNEALYPLLGETSGGEKYLF